MKEKESINNHRLPVHPKYFITSSCLMLWRLTRHYTPLPQYTLICTHIHCHTQTHARSLTSTWYTHQYGSAWVLCLVCALSCQHFHTKVHSFTNLSNPYSFSASGYRYVQRQMKISMHKWHLDCNHFNILNCVRHNNCIWVQSYNMKCITDV